MADETHLPPHQLEGRRDVYGKPPIRGVMIAIDAPDDRSADLPRSMEMFFNPDQVGLAAGAEWARIAVPGLSHEVLQYSHSMSDEMTFTLQWSALEAIRRLRNAQAPGEQMRRASVRRLPVNNIDPFLKIRELTESLPFVYRDFLKSFTVPVEAGRAPSRCMFIWPNMVSMIAVITDVDFSFTKISTQGLPMAWSCNLSFVELRRVFRQRSGRKRFFTQISDPQLGPQVNQITDLLNRGQEVKIE